MFSKLRLSQAKMATATASLSALSPLDVLTRGYSVTLDQQGQAITSTEEVQLGDRIVTRLKGGQIESIVDQIADLSYTDGPMDADHSLKGQAEIMTDFANQVMPGPYILFGHDLGGGIAQIMVTDPELKEQNEVRKIVIGNSAVLDMWPVPEANAAIAKAKSAEASQIFSADNVREIVKNFASAGLMQPEETLTDEILEDLYGNYAENESTRNHFIEYLKAMDNRLTLEASPQMVMWNKPAMLLWGVHDPFQPPYVSGVALARIMPHATWEYLDASHFYPLERPQQVVDAFVAWDQQ